MGLSHSLQYLSRSVDCDFLLARGERYLVMNMNSLPYRGIGLEEEWGTSTYPRGCIDGTQGLPVLMSVGNAEYGVRSTTMRMELEKKEKEK